MRHARLAWTVSLAFLVVLTVCRAEGAAGKAAPQAVPPAARAVPGAPSAPSAGASDSRLISLRRAIQDLMTTYGPKYPKGPEYLARLDALEKEAAAAPAAGGASGPAGAQPLAAWAQRLETLRREALLANPLLDFDRLLVVKRGIRQLGLPQNWQSNSSIPQHGYDNEIDVLRLGDVGGRAVGNAGQAPVPPVPPALTTLFRPAKGEFVGDLNLHFDGDRILFSMPAGTGRWQVHELRIPPAGGSAATPAQVRQVTPHQPGVDNYDACYLPDGAILFGSTACMQGVPCVAGSDHVSNLYRLEADGKTIRQLCFDQDHDWYPSVLNDGRVIYTRWEYSDLPHAFNRLLFHMNPDGSEQMEYYGSNSYWPNSTFYARAIPGHPTKVVGVISGHHGVCRMGELVIFDPAAGRHEADGALQRIPGYGKKVEPVIVDQLVDASWPKFLHPWPLSEKYFLVSCLPGPRGRWGVYLVDIFDNMVCLFEQEGYAMLEPIPLRKRPCPPVVPSKVDPRRSDAVVYVSDVYNGPGLAGVPRGLVRKLRVFTYHFAYQGMGGQQMRIGLDGPWDIKRIMGTVPVEEDGSAMFRVPANTPISLQPLDADGRALQVMRSWMTPMPGEILSCAGCHEKQNATPVNRSTIASRRGASEIAPWYGPTRGFSFQREVQPVLDQYCVSCHDGDPRPDGRLIADLRDKPPINVNPIPNLHGIGNFQPAYFELRRFVRGYTIESDLHLLMAGECHADTTQLVQMLRKGHYDVHLDAEAWDRLFTWIDLNTPCHGTWKEVVGQGPVTAQHDLRKELKAKYAGIDEDPEDGAGKSAPAVIARKAPRKKAAGSGVAAGAAAKAAAGADKAVTSLSWPDAPVVAPVIPASAAGPTRLVDLGGGVKLELVRISAGEFVMGDAAGGADEQPPTRVKIAAPFWMARCEVSNQQYDLFDPGHDSRLERPGFLHFSPAQRGLSMNLPAQPVVRLSWTAAMEFCRWLSQKTGEAFTLPTEAQWEYACRAGTATPMWFGPIHADFSRLANLADACVNDIGGSRFSVPHIVLPPYHLAVNNINDGYRVTAPVGSYQPNPWGLYDMHGNAAEWTLSSYRPYPYRDDDGRNPPVGADLSKLSPTDRKVARGGSWYDRPERARSAFRLNYAAWQGVFDVGFRVACPAEAGAKVAAR